MVCHLVYRTLYKMVLLVQITLKIKEVLVDNGQMCFFKILEGSKNTIMHTLYC